MTHAGSDEFDGKKPVTLKGKVKELHWNDPHVVVDVETNDKSGGNKNWRVEMGSVAEMEEHGWTEDTLKPGDPITVEGNLAKSEPLLAAARMVEMAGGKKLSASSECHPS